MRSRSYQLIDNARRRAEYALKIKRPTRIKCANPACGTTFKYFGQGKRKYCPGGCQQQARNIRDRGIKICKWCGAGFPPISYAAQFCSEEHMYEYQVKHLGQKEADKRAYQRATAKRQREHEARSDKTASKESGYCPQSVQYMTPEKIDGDWDKIWRGLATAPKVPPHRRN